MSALDRLLAVSGPEAGPPVAQKLPQLGDRGRELQELLSVRNGFLAFESALHVFGQGVGAPFDVSFWNARDLWIAEFEGMADGMWFFAEDLFGCQFAIADEEVVAFDPETGASQPLAPDLEGWAAAILEDYALLTGYPLAHAWQVEHGSLPTDCRLVPTIPFVLGGDFAVSNLHPLERVRGMRLRASIALQLRDLPDGAQVTFQVGDT